MRKIIVQEFITLDGVMQGPGGPEKGFKKYGGWSAPYYDEALGKIAEKLKKPAKDLLLGRKTFEVNASFWPEHEDMWPGINDVTKYVVSKTIKKSDWKNSVFLDSVEDIKKLKKSEVRDLLVFGTCTGRFPTFRFEAFVCSFSFSRFDNPSTWRAPVMYAVWLSRAA